MVLQEQTCWINVRLSVCQINNQVLHGRSHQNASAIIKSAAARVKLLLLRYDQLLVLHPSGSGGGVLLLGGGAGSDPAEDEDEEGQLLGVLEVIFRAPLRSSEGP